MNKKLIIIINVLVKLWFGYESKSSGKKNYLYRCNYNLRVLAIHYFIECQFSTKTNLYIFIKQSGHELEKL